MKCVGCIPVRFFFFDGSSVTGYLAGGVAGIAKGGMSLDTDLLRGWDDLGSADERRRGGEEEKRREEHRRETRGSYTSRVPVHRVRGLAASALQVLLYPSMKPASLSELRKERSRRRHFEL